MRNSWKRRNSNWGVQIATAGGLCAVLIAAGPVHSDGFDPFQSDPWGTKAVVPLPDPFESVSAGAPAPQPEVRQAVALPSSTGSPYPVTNVGYQPQSGRPQPSLSPTPATAPTAPGGPVGPLPAPNCGTPNERPIGQLTIQTQMPQGDFPLDRAAACWEQLNAAGGPLAAARFWSKQAYNWEATCMAHRPLYFEEVNLERYGYGCHDCLQPIASAAHFFATVPALPYCIGANCPGECQYTLGHYRPGSCPPWRCHRPPVSGLGALSAGGVWTGLIFLIP